MKIAFASCSKLQQVDPQPVWSDVQQERVDALLLLGDNVYLDHDRHHDAQALTAELSELYARQIAERHFAALLADLRARGAKFLATYDDHDFLGDNRYGGDHDPSLRLAARKALVGAFSPPRTGEDVYSVQRVGPVAVVVLDARFYRRHWSASGSDRDAVLGAAQWQWLERTVHESEGAPYLLIASSTTFHRFANESWEQYPAAFERMRALLIRRRGAVIVSGDVHRNALSDDSGIIEVVSSAVARRSLGFNADRRNYALLEFDADSMRITTRSLKAQGRFDVRVPLERWVLP